MKIFKIQLIEFRCYEYIEIDLHSQLTVFVAENGQGKTSILDAIRIGLRPFVGSFDLAKEGHDTEADELTVDDMRLIKKEDGSMVRSPPSGVILLGKIDNSSQILSWACMRLSESSRDAMQEDGDADILRKQAAALQNRSRNNKTLPVLLPVIAYYGTNRHLQQKGNAWASNDKNNDGADFYINTFAYRDCLHSNPSYQQFQEWFTWIYLRQREHVIRQYERNQTISIPAEISAPIIAVQNAIDTVLKEATGWHTLTYSISDERSLMLNHDQLGTMKADQLSDGIRNTMALVGDIAYRCVKLNPHLGAAAPQHTPGIVLIDEVDMHLHPRWQQLILEQLQTAFPQVQFIVTTHSPQVLSTVNSECIRVLRSVWDEENEQYQPSIVTDFPQTKGVASSDILASVMQIDPIPDQPEARSLSRYQQLIQQNEEESEEGLRLREKLLAHFGPRHPAMLECERLIRLQALKRKLPQAR